MWKEVGGRCLHITSGAQLGLAGHFRTETQLAPLSCGQCRRCRSSPALGCRVSPLGGCWAALRTERVVDMMALSSAGEVGGCLGGPPGSVEPLAAEGVAPPLGCGPPLRGCCAGHPASPGAPLCGEGGWVEGSAPRVRWGGSLGGPPGPVEPLLLSGWMPSGVVLDWVGGVLRAWMLSQRSMVCSCLASTASLPTRHHASRLSRASWASAAAS